MLWQQGRVGISQGTSGAELPPALLSRHDRQVLKSGFRSILRLLEFTADRGWLGTAVTACVPRPLPRALRADLERRRRRSTRVRFVVLDSETTGPESGAPTASSRSARSRSIGGEIVLEDSFDALLKVERNTARSPCTASRATRARQGVQEPEALERSSTICGDGVIVGHHIGHDIATLDAACERHWGVRLSNRSLDTMDLTLHLERTGAFAGRPPIRHFTLDALCDDVRRDPARSAHRERRCVHHRAGVSAAGAAGRAAAAARSRASPSRSRSNRRPLQVSCTA